MLKRLVALVAITALQFAAQFPAHAQAAPGTAKPVYGILSLVGDKLDVVVGQYQTGSATDRTLRQSVTMDDPVFDKLMQTHVARGLRAELPGTEIAVLDTRSQVLFDKQADLFTVSTGVMTMPDAIRKALAEQGASKLILVTKHRSDIAFDFVTGIEIGRGVSGLGFYLDGSTEVTTTARDGSRFTGRGFIACYAFFRLTLVDLATGKVEASEVSRANVMAGTGKSNEDIMTPWNALTSKQKVEAIGGLIDREAFLLTRELVRQAARK